MPFVSNMDNEEQKTDQGSIPQGAIAPVGGGAVRLSPSSAVPSGGTSVGTSSGPGNAGGQFATLNQYLTANQGQAEPLAGRLTAGIGQQYQNLQGQNATLLGDIGSQVNANAIPNASGTLSQEAANPASFASSPSNVASFKNLLNATYSGPASAEGTPQYQQQQAAINNAIATGQASTQTEAGRENLIQQNEATPTTGVTALNSAILTQSPTALQSVEKAYDPFANLLTGLGGGAQSIDQSIAKTQGDIAAANAEANRQIADQASSFNAGLNATLSNAQQAVDQYNQGVQALQASQAANQPLNAALQQGGLLSALGIANPFAGTYTSAATPTMNTVATPDQLNLQQALIALGGNPGTLINPNAPVGGYIAPGAVPSAPDIQSLLDRVAMAEYNREGLNKFGPATSGSQASKELELLGSQNVDPFRSLMQQLNQIYGTKYVQPTTLATNNVPIQGLYNLSS